MLPEEGSFTFWIYERKVDRSLYVVLSRFQAYLVINNIMVK